MLNAIALPCKRAQCHSVSLLARKHEVLTLACTAATASPSLPVNVLPLTAVTEAGHTRCLTLGSSRL